MLPEQQQRILGYFIEEAKDHLNTIEQGLLNLSETINDQEMVNEVFRAAHSIKGGAAMLGLTSIQRTAHRLEDCFKILKENKNVPIDQKLESLFLGVSDTLKALLEHLQGPFGLTEEIANDLMSEAEPVFGWLNEHLDLLVKKGNSVAPEVANSKDVIPIGLAKNNAAALENFQNQVLSSLRELLQIFKQPATVENRQQLQDYCYQLVKLGEELNLKNWCLLCQAAKGAIGNPDNSYLLLAKIVITEIKSALSLVQQNRDGEIAVSEQLAVLLSQTQQELLPDSTTQPNFTELEVIPEPTSEPPITSDVVTNLNQISEFWSPGDSDQMSEISANLDIIASEASFDVSQSSEPVIFYSSDLIEGLTINSSLEDMQQEELFDPNGPSMGIAELTTLAHLFENDSPELEESWSSEEISISGSPNVEAVLAIVDDNKTENSDLEDLLSLKDNKPEVKQNDDAVSESDLTLLSLFGDDFVEEPDLKPEHEQTVLIDFSLLDEPNQFNDEASETSDDFDDLLAINNVSKSDDGLSEEFVLDNSLNADLFTQSAKTIESENLDNLFLSSDDEISQSEDANLDNLFDIIHPGAELNFDVSDNDDFWSISSPEESFDEQLLREPSVAELLEESLFAAQTLSMQEAVSPSNLQDEANNQQEDLFLDVRDKNIDFIDAGELDTSDWIGSSEDLFEQKVTSDAALTLDSHESHESFLNIGLEDSVVSVTENSLEFDGLLVSDNSDTFAVLPSQTAQVLPNIPEPLELTPEFTNVSEGIDEINLVQPSTQAEIDFFATLLGEGEDTGLENDRDEISLGVSNEPDNLFAIDVNEPIDTDETFVASFEFDEFETFEQFDTFEQNSIEITPNLESIPPVAISELTDDSEVSLSELNLGFDVEDKKQVNEDNFALLEELLDSSTIDQPDTEVSSVSTSQNQIDEFTQLEALLDETPGFNNAALYNDDFAQLEALLDMEAPKLQSPHIGEPANGAGFVTPQTPKNPTPQISLSTSDDEFGDLEKLLIDADKSVSTNSDKASAGRTQSRRTARFEQLMKVPVKHLDDMSNLVGELVVNRNTLEQDQERLRQSLDNLLHQVMQLSDVGARMQELYERSLLEASLLQGRQNKEFPRQQKEEDLDRGFSELEMDRFTPFHTLSQEMIELIVRVRESASDIDFVTEETERVARQFRTSTTQLQEGLTRARMEPFSQVTDRLKRGVRDNAIKCGKQVELIIDGQDTLIDKMILQHLTDPLTHMLNNAIAHGIETLEEREAKGKPTVGTIKVRAFHQGNQTVISVSDDGAGIDPQRVKSKAIKVGLITAQDAQNMSKNDIYELLFQPGFSTKDQADGLAGRGVGMDVVLTSISEIRGTITTDSQLGKGTTFTIRLPLTLSICKALCCVSDKGRVAFPMDGVEDTVDIPVKNIQHHPGGQAFIQWRDTQLPFKPLKELLTLNRQMGRGNVYGGTRDDDMVSVVVVRSASTVLGLQVDLVLSEQEIVIKQFEGPAPKPIGVAGATVLGDGRIMPIADVLEIIDLFHGRTSKQSAVSIFEPPTLSESKEAKIDPTVLIVDDSITVRELLSLTFNKAGYRVEQARDGQEAWDKLRSGLPCDIVFCDIEMPRCDGLELLSRIQKDAQLSQLPIAMLTSRGADKHRQMAINLGASGYFTKPYLEEALLDAASRMLKGEKLVHSS